MPARRPWPCAFLFALALPTCTMAPKAEAGPQAVSSPPAEVRRIQAAALALADTAGRAFVVIDKPRARVWVYAPDGALRGSAPVLLGLARGDASVPGIGSRPIRDILPDERTTPAGRHVIEAGRNHTGEDIYWVDYDAAVSMHRVRATVPAERRLQRLATPTADDNRISYGCINVPAAFYDAVLRPTLGRGGVAYVLPDHEPIERVFAGLFDR